MPLKASGRDTEMREIDRFDGGVGWIAHPEEDMQRASHALATDEGVWLVDPVDAEGVDDLVDEFGSVAGVVVLFGRHTRDAATIANRHDVPVRLPSALRALDADLDAPVESFDGELPETGYHAITLADTSFWTEVALYHDGKGTLLVPESVGTASYFLAGPERLGVHPMRRLLPPRGALGRFVPDRVLVGHGAGILDDAAAALRTALSGARRRTPRLYATNLRLFLPL